MGLDTLGALFLIIWRGGIRLLPKKKKKLKPPRHRGRREKSFPEFLGDLGVLGGEKILCWMSCRSQAIRKDPNRLYKRTVSTSMVKNTYMRSPSMAKAATENMTRTIGVAISTSKPNCMMARESPENAARTIP